MLITISISSAPLLIASLVSYTLASVVILPSGNPITVQTKTSLPFKHSFEYEIKDGFTHTDLKSYFLLSSQRALICSLVASAFNNVLSIYLL